MRNFKVLRTEWDFSNNLRTNRALFWFIYLFVLVLADKEYSAAGLVNYCVPSGEAHKKALNIAREINEKVGAGVLTILLVELHI